MTFLTMAYIVVLNPLILGFVPDSTGEFLGGGTGRRLQPPGDRRGHRAPSPAC